MTIGADLVVWCRWGRPARAFLVLLVLGAMGGCDAESRHRQLSLAERNFSHNVELEGRPTLHVTSEYVGKAPDDPGSYSSSHDYRRIDTDFYRLTLENLSDRPLIMERVDYRMEHGPFIGEQSADAASIRRNWATNVIPPGTRLSRGNNMVWSKPRSNRMWKTYYFRMASEGDTDRSFSVDVPLAYSR